MDRRPGRPRNSLTCGRTFGTRRTGSTCWGRRNVCWSAQWPMAVILDHDLCRLRAPAAALMTGGGGRRAQRWPEIWPDHRAELLHAAHEVWRACIPPMRGLSTDSRDYRAVDRLHAAALAFSGKISEGVSGLHSLATPAGLLSAIAGDGKPRSTRCWLLAAEMHALRSGRFSIFRSTKRTMPKGSSPTSCRWPVQAPRPSLLRTDPPQWHLNPRHGETQHSPAIPPSIPLMFNK